MMEELVHSRPGDHSRSGSYDDSASDRGINFTMFLTMMSERLFEFDTEAELIEAFESFDEDDSGVVKVEEMKKWLSELGGKMDQKEVSHVVSLQVSDLFNSTHQRLTGS
jgi:myosin regulatory light chain 12